MAPMDAINVNYGKFEEKKGVIYVSDELYCEAILAISRLIRGYRAE